MAYDFMNCRMRMSLKLFGMAQRKNRAVTSTKGNMRPCGTSGACRLDEWSTCEEAAGIPCNGACLPVFGIEPGFGVSSSSWRSMLWNRSTEFERRMANGVRHRTHRSVFAPDWCGIIQLSWKLLDSHFSAAGAVILASR